MKTFLWAVAYNYLPTVLARPVCGFVAWLDAREIARRTA